MQNKKLLLTLSLSVVVIGGAAFVAGRMLNGQVGTVGLGGPEGERVSISIDEVTPAPQLPPSQADVTGLFVERKDNVIFVQAVTFSVGVGGVAGESPMDENSGVKVEVVVTSQTQIFRDVTEIPEPVNGEIHGVQQAADEGSLEDMDTETFVTVWGRRSGDRLIAEVIFYSNPKHIEKP